MSDSDEFRIWHRVWVQRNITEHRNRRERERADTTIYIGSSHNTGVVHSLCTSKGFHYNHYWSQLLNDSSKRLSNAQAPLQETSNAQGNYQKTSTTQGQL